MIWLTVIFGLLGLLLAWFKGINSLTATQIRKLNNLIYRCRQIEAKAVPLGCAPGGVDGDPTQAGEEEPSESIWADMHGLPTDPESMRATIISGIDGALGHTFLITGDNRRLLQGQRAYWAQADALEVYKLITLLPKEN